MADTTTTTRDQELAAKALAAAMQLDGAKAGDGDVLQALALLGLRLVSDDGGDPFATLKAITESTECDCGSVWVRLRDVVGSGAGWWHQDVSFGGFVRKCPNGARRPSAT